MGPRKADSRVGENEGDLARENRPAGKAVMRVGENEGELSREIGLLVRRLIRRNGRGYGRDEGV